MSNNFNYSYKLLEIYPQDINSFFQNQKQLDGFNVTMPYKTFFYNTIKNRAHSASKFRSTNTIVKLNNKNFKCHNTDGYGFLKSLEHYNVPLKNNVLILGLGGAGRVIAITAILNGCHTTIAVRKNSIKKAENVLKEICNITKKIEIIDISKIPIKQYNLIVNATPIGMRGYCEEFPINIDILKYSKTVIDLIYNPPITPILKQAKKLKLKAFNGLYMLIFQAIKANEIFTNYKFKKNTHTKIAEKLKKLL